MGKARRVTTVTWGGDEWHCGAGVAIGILAP
jgi:hypothetical protein